MDSIPTWANCWAMSPRLEISPTSTKRSGEAGTEPAGPIKNLVPATGLTPGVAMVVLHFQQDAGDRRCRR
jgi:hypothetical protein